MQKTKSIVTKFTEYCAICGSPAVEIHHLLSGNDRKKADADSIVLPLCNMHHTGDRNLSVHLNPAINAWSKMLAEVAWERKYISEHQCSVDDSREAFKERYGKNYL